MLSKILHKVPIGVCSVILTLVVLYLTLSPSPLPKGMTAWSGADKVGHFIFFFALTTSYLIDCIRLCYPRSASISTLIFVSLSTAALAAAIEFLQTFMTLGRQGSIADFVFDVVGIVVAYILYKVWLKKFILNLYKNQ